MRGASHARSIVAGSDTRRCDYIRQRRFCESLQWPNKSAKTAKNRRGFQRLWFALVLVFLFIPCNALALTAGDMGVVWGPNPVGRWGSGESDESGVICVADNTFNAALVTCGVMTNDERLTADAKAKLSNDSSGGSFYTLSTTFHCFQGEDGYTYPSWNRAATGVVDSMANLFGPENVWWGLYESYLLTSAKEDLTTVLNGGSLGGGGSGSGSGSGQLATVNKFTTVYTDNVGFYLQDTNNTKYYLGGQEPIAPQEIIVTFDNITWPQLPTGNYTYVYMLLNAGRLGPKRVVPRIYAFTNDEPTITYSTDFLGNRYISRISNLGTGYFLDCHLNTPYVYGDGVMSVDFSDRTFDISTITSIDISLACLYSYKDSIIDDPLPPTNWPETEPTTPKTKPVVPDPPDTTAPTVPTYDPKSYTNPVITTGTGDTYNNNTTNIYNYNYETSNASGQDIIPYLQAILAALNNITRNIATYMLNVQNLINDVIACNDNNTSQIIAKLQLIITAINNVSSTINSGIGELDTDINAGLGEIYELIGDFQGAVHNEFKSLKTYLKSLFQWLADQFDYTFDGGDYDDSSILYWLRRIYYKLGAGRVNTRPTDPVADPVGIGDWLAQLFRNFLGGLLGIGGEALDAVLDALDDLRNKFPFSIPWDLAAILGLLVADPVAPNFDVPQYTITNEGLQQVATYHIDLAVFDDVMVGVRTMETLVFAFCLAFKTDFFKGLLTVHGGD